MRSETLKEKERRYWDDGLESDQIRSSCDPRGYKCTHNRRENLIWSLNYTTNSTTRTDTQTCTLTHTNKNINIKNYVLQISPRCTVIHLEKWAGLHLNTAEIVRSSPNEYIALISVSGISLT